MCSIMVSSARRRLAVAIALPIFSLILASCGSGGDNSGTPGSFVGRVANSSAFISIVTNGTDARAYMCDGTPDGHLTIAEWFKGKQSGDTVDLESLSGIAHLNAHIASSAATGSVTLPGVSDLTFSAPPAQGAGGYYLYKYIHGGVLRWAGWIVLNTGEQVGSMPTPVRTSLGVTLDLSSGTAQIPEVGTVTPGHALTTNVIRQFQGCFPGSCF